MPLQDTALRGFGLLLLVGAPLAWLGSIGPATVGEIPGESAMQREVSTSDDYADRQLGSPADAAEADDESPASPAPRVAIDPATWPVSVRIDRVDVTATVVPIGLDSHGEMDVPPDAATVGWYQRGVAPGRAGTAILTGHVDTRRDGPGAFFELVAVEPGDEVHIDLGSGDSQTWQVVGRERVAKEDIPQDVLYARDGEPLLALVTCGGTFDASRGSYRDNVIVYARLIDRPLASASTIVAAPTIEAPATSS